MEMRGEEREKNRGRPRERHTVRGSRKFLELMVHNKRLSVPKLVMSVRAGLISFLPFNKYVAEVICHNFSRASRPHARPPLSAHRLTRDEERNTNVAMR